MQNLQDKVAIITGAASGIGRAIAERCVREGMKVVLADVEAAALEETEQTLRAQGGDILAVQTNVADADSVAALAEATLAHFGAVHLLCNNAGVALSDPIWQATIADWEWLLGVNLWGVIHGIRTFVPIMLEQGDTCHIVNTASIAGLISPMGLGPYNVSKHAVVTLSETLYQELQTAESKIGVSVLCPAWVKTRIDQSERNRPGRRPAKSSATGEQGTVSRAVASGIAPKVVAERVVDAIQQEQFYVFTHPDFMRLVEQRHEEIHSGRNPAISTLR